MKIVLFRYSPYAIMPNYIDDDTILLVPKSVESKYCNFAKDGYRLPQIEYIDDFVLPEIVRLIRNLSKKNRITSISTLSEEDMGWVGLLADYFVNNLTTYGSNTLFKDKYYMRSFLIDIVNQPYFRLIKGIEDIEIFFNNIKSDSAIIKPRCEAGAEGVFRYNKGEVIKDKSIFQGNYIIEELVDINRMLTADGYAIGSKIKRFFSHDYPEGLLLDSMEDDGCGELIVRTNGLYDTNRDILYKVLEGCKRILNEISVQDEMTPFHFEWFYDEKKSKIVFCEVGKRFGGGSIPQLIQEAFNIDILKEYWSQMKYGEDKSILEVSSNNISVPSKIACTYAPYKKKGLVINSPSDEEFDFFIKYWKYVKVGDVFEMPHSIVENAFIGIFISISEEEYAEQIVKARKLSQKIKYRE